MKAVILAGGAGSRLRPISAETPKPLVKLFDKPVMAYIMELLRTHGITDITATLQTMPQKIIDYFGDGGEYGVRMRYSVEKNPLGTAGGVRAALAGQMDREPVLIMSGDAVTDVNLTAALETHRRHSAHATLLLSRQKKLLDYGLVMTDEHGRIKRFIEKPGWGQVFTDTVNTGIYILSPEAVALIPEEGAYDFARDLFPQMLSEGMRLYGHEAPGYWCDIGDCEAYMQCCRDVLDGRVALSLPPSQTSPADCTVSLPSYIAQTARLGKNVRIGSYAIIGGGSRLEDNTQINGGVLDGAVLETGARCEGAYLGRGAVLGRNAVANEGCIIGNGCRIGDGAELLEGVRLWPRKDVESDARVVHHIHRGSAYRGVVFDGKGRMRGRLNADLTPEFNTRLGMAAATIAQNQGGEVAISWQGGHAARLCAAAISLGVDSAGGRSVETDALSPACASFAGGMYRIPLSIFVRQQEDSLELYFFDGDGLFLDHAASRKLEAEALRGDAPLGQPLDMRASRAMSGLQELYARSASIPPAWVRLGYEPIPLRATGGGSSTETLRRTLAAVGCSSTGAALSISDDGLNMSCVLENGRELDLHRLQGVALLIEAALGAKETALPNDAPVFLEEFAKEQGLRVYREGRDGERARALLCDQPYLRDMVYLAARLAHGLRRLGVTLEQLARRIPDFFIAQGEIPLEKDRGEVMRELVGLQPEAELHEGFYSRHKNGWVHVAPLPSRRALHIAAEGRTMEAAKEIFADYSRMAKGLDKTQKNNPATK